MTKNHDDLSPQQDIPEHAYLTDDPNWEVTPERLESLRQIGEMARAKIQAMREAQPLYKYEDGTSVRGSFVRFEPSITGGLRPVYQTPDGILFLVSPFYDPASEDDEDNSDENR
jgi:hypothetical protein